MKLTSLLLPSLCLFSVLPKCKADNSTQIEYVFLEQTFQSEPCVNKDYPPIWKINSTNLINDTIIESYFGEVKLRNDDVTSDYHSTLILEHVNFTLNSSVVSCSNNSTLILNNTLVVVNTTIKWLAPNETFTPPVCISPLVKSPPPNWMINGEILDDKIVISRYNAHVDRSGYDRRGRHQANLTIYSVNTTLSGGNVTCTCAVGNETIIRRVYILYITDEATTTPVTPEAENTTEVVTETSTNGASVDEPSAGSVIAKSVTVSVIVVIIVLLAGTAVVIIALYVFFIKRKTIKKTRRGGVESDGGDEDDDETDGVKGAAPPPISKEQAHEPLLRKRISTTKI